MIVRKSSFDENKITSQINAGYIYSKKQGARPSSHSSEDRANIKHIKRFSRGCILATADENKLTVSLFSQFNYKQHFLYLILTFESKTKNTPLFNSSRTPPHTGEIPDEKGKVTN